MSVNLSQLADELTAALAEFSKIQQIIQDANERMGKPPPDTFEMYALGGILHDLYHGMEGICLRVVKQIDQQEPIGSSWHRDLIDSVSHPVPNLRPAIINQETAELLEQYRGFRHRFRHNYGFELSWLKLTPLWRDAPAMIKKFVNDIEQFINFLRMMSS
ncbi:MAG: hypothetical protein GY805_31465 [Chloroflexi bacterium]|nr:hypothetical protein [Chloroflexota bacterium]